MKNKILLISLIGCFVMSLTACMKHPTNPGDGQAKNLTVGTVQGEIKEGMPASDVAAILGSPNIVTTDEKRREVWVYDKVSSDRIDTANSFGVGIPLIIRRSSGQSQSTSSQKTLTIIIKFDEEKKVRDYAYNYTQF
jgi:outer membrane protein assembly factor BamE (lipoprotein component of BamABCDE complex)